MSLVQDSRSIRRMATCSPVGRYRAKFTAIKPSKPRPKTQTAIRNSTSIWKMACQYDASKSHSNMNACFHLHTNNCEEIIGAAVREVAAHGVPSGEGGQTVLAIFMGLEGGRHQKLAHFSQDCVKQPLSHFTSHVSYMWAHLLTDH